MSITSEEGYFIYETMGVSEIIVFLVIPDYRDCYYCTVITSMDECSMGR